MKPSEIFLIPGEQTIRLALEIIEIPIGNFNSSLLTVFAAIVSWLFWVSVLRLVGTLTLRIFGLDRKGGF